MSQSQSIFPEPYREVLENFLSAYWYDRVRQVTETVLGLHIPMVSNETLYNSGFAHELALLAEAATGKLERTDQNIGEVNETVQSLCERLFAAPGLGSSYEIPNSFWLTPLGQMVARARLWQFGDQLISIAEAAKLVGKKAQTISAAVGKGRLMAYYDPDSPGERQGRVKVSRANVLRLWG